MSRCDECDPSFGCFSGAAPCRKVPLHPSSIAAPSSGHRYGSNTDRYLPEEHPTAPAWTPERERSIRKRLESKAPLPYRDDLAAALAEIARKSDQVDYLVAERDTALRRIAELEVENTRLRRACEALEAEWAAGVEARS